MALDPIQQSPYTSYPYFQKDYNTAASFSQGFQDSQKEAMNRIAMDTAQQQQITADQAMRVRDLEEARKQILFKRQQGEWGRADAAARTGAGMQPGFFSMGGAPTGGSGMMPQAPAATPAPAATAPGPQAEYNPEADRLSVRGAPVQHFGTGNVGGFYVPVATGPEVNALPTFAASPITAPTTTDSRMGIPLSRYSLDVTNGMPMTAGLTGAPAEPWQSTAIPYQNVDTSLPAAQSRRQAGIRASEINSTIKSIPYNIASGTYSGVPLRNDPTEALRFTESELAQRGATRAQMQSIFDFYNNPQVKEYLRSDAALAQYASQDPIRFYQQNAASIMPQPGQAPAAAAPAQTQTPAPAAGAPAATSVVPGNTGAAGYASEAGLRTPNKAPTLTEQTLTAGPGETVKPNTMQYQLEPAMIDIERRQMSDAMNMLQQQYERARLRRDYAAMTDIEGKALMLKNNGVLLNGMQAITDLNAGRPEQLAALLNQMSRGQIKIQPRADGNFNIYNGNTMTGENITPDQLANSSRMIFDRQYQAQVSAAKEAELARASKIFDARVEGLKEALKQTAIGTKEMSIKTLEAQIKAQYPQMRTAADPTGRGVYLYDESGTVPMAIVTLQQEIGTDGKPVLNPDKTPKLVPNVQKLVK